MQLQSISVVQIQYNNLNKSRLISVTRVCALCADLQAVPLADLASCIAGDHCREGAKAYSSSSERNKETVKAAATATSILACLEQAHNLAV